MNTDNLVAEAERISGECQALLAGKGQFVQGTVLLDLVALWLAGHNPAFRDEALDLWLATLKDLVPVCERQILERYPNGWTRQ